MQPDDLKQTWQSQAAPARLTIDVELLANEVRRNDRAFGATIFWRDVREVGISLLLIPVWIYLGQASKSPWTWYLTIPGLVWIAGFMLVDRWLHRPRDLAIGAPLRQCVERSLAELDHQIWLLRNVLWWYILPPAVGVLAFLAQLGWEIRAGGWLTVVGIGGLAGTVLAVFAVIHRINQVEVRSALLPRRQELQALLASLEEEEPA